MDKKEHERAIMEASECEASDRYFEVRQLFDNSQTRKTFQEGFYRAWNLRESNQWQPIATAPTDGTVIDLWHKDWGRVVDQNYKEGDKFTHWMPLPGAPKA